MDSRIFTKFTNGVSENPLKSSIKILKQNKMEKMKIDFITIDFIDDNFENEWSYIMGYDSGNDYTKPKELINNIDENLWEKIGEIRKLCFPKD